MGAWAFALPGVSLHKSGCNSKAIKRRDLLRVNANGEVHLVIAAAAFIITRS